MQYRVYCLLFTDIDVMKLKKLGYKPFTAGSKLIAIACGTKKEAEINMKRIEHAGICCGIEMYSDPIKNKYRY